ncbi:L-asparaginase [Angomonas deanei]|uniref:asparaginase n=1 Tax=Angomonas deanei TaxID=59799 RepID=S9WUR2_9TRYP|nr:L-asparaginase [Angomonas deanei]EPY39890.1 L-asparaginase [Angomonas deanei]EPY42073.1 L-asparaginase [Angomonas deanei]CAD2218447.1 Asparaginase, N-terminal/Glutaminase/Asparaginase C-terminal domain containing protein, putative [Angomonas deanei]|eukprot:EPY28742.1 L-asparaginase [Angomonas deanei]
MLSGSSSSRRVLVLYVGGTIGMKKNAKGSLEPCPNYLTQEMNNMQELKPSASSAVAQFEVKEYETLLDSSDMNHRDHLRIANDVAKHYEAYDGFLIAHGTDTMHYTATALSFLLFNLAKPVIVTGAMVPLAEPFNDARRNLILSLMIASNPSICEVCVFFNDSLFRGNRCNKVRHNYAAFESTNYPALGVMEGSQFVLRERLLLPQPTGAMQVCSRLDGKVACLHVVPDNELPTILPAILKEGTLEGLVLVVPGVGKLHGALAETLRPIAAFASQQKVVVALVVQDLRGTLQPSEEARLRRTLGDTVVYVGDMTPTSAEVKLSYLIGKRRPDGRCALSYEKIRSTMTSNLRGELTPSGGPMPSL